MSRCFPFPPPGYEKKTRSDDTDLLTKEKRKEKRHQKDKKDKDRREGKEKKDEERSKEKNREKKDRKEKKKDKKERNRDREKNRTSDEKRIEGKPASYNGEKPHPNNLPGVEISNSKIVQELGRRLGDKDKIVGSPMVQKVTLTDKGRPELEGSMVESNIGNSAEKKRKSKDKNDTGKANGQGNKVEARNPENAAAHNSGWMDQQRIEQGYIGTWSEEKRKTNDKNDAGKANGQGNKVQARVSENATVHNYGWMDQRRVAQSNIGNWAEEERKSKDKNDAGKANGQGNKVEARGPENATVHNSPWMDQRRTGQSIIGNWAEEKSKTKDKDDARKANGQENKVEAKGPESATVHTSARMDQRRIEGMQVEKKDVEKQVKVKENNEHNGSHSRGDKKKDKDREKKSKSKDKHRNKKEKMEKMKGKREPDTKQTELKGSDQASIDTQNIKSETLLKGNSKSFATSGNLGKRKEHETNGLFHENRMQPNKLPRPIASSHPIVENGWKSDPSQIITQFAPEKQVLPFNHKADIKEHKINALAETQHSNSASMNSSSTTVQTTEKCEASAKQPHPDSKYLSQILSVPKIEECSNFDDQEWLFSSKNLQSKKMEVGSLGFDGTMQFPKGSFQEGMLTSGPDFTNSYCILLLIILSQISSLSWCIREWFREGFRIPIRKLHETQCRIAESWLGVLFHCLESFITYLYSSTFNNFDL